MNELVYNKSFSEWEAELNTEIKRAADSFVRIGYLLKVARDTDILKGSGYAGITEYAKANYGLDKTQVSRFVAIYERFGVEGSPELKERYKQFGYSKLALMLQLPDEINEELTPEYSKSEINAIKTEYDEESKISDLEVYAESREVTEADYNLLEQCIYKICEENIDTYKRLHNAVTTDIGVADNNIVELLAPAGEKIYSVRIAGVGRIAVSAKKDDAYVHTINMRSNEKDNWSLDEVVNAVVKIINSSEADVRTAWQQLYKQPWPEEEKTEIAPEQQHDKPVPRKEKKVTKAKVEKAKEIIDVPAREIESSEDHEAEKVNMITESPNFEAEMAAVDNMESDIDIREGIITMALNISYTLQERANDDRIGISLLNTLHSTAVSIADKLEILMRRGDDNE